MFAVGLAEMNLRHALLLRRIGLARRRGLVRHIFGAGAFDFMRTLFPSGVAIPLVVANVTERRLSIVLRRREPGGEFF